MNLKFSEFPIIRLSVLAILFVLFGGGCTTSTHVLTGVQRNPIDPSLVRVYSTAPRGSSDIAILTASSEDSLAFTNQGKIEVVMGRLKSEAAQLGANGIILQKTIEKTISSDLDYETDPEHRGIETEFTGHAIAIYVPTTDR